VNSLEFARKWYENGNEEDETRITGLAKHIDKYFVSRPAPLNKQTKQQQTITILSAVTGLDWRIKRNVGRLAKTGKELSEAGYTIEEVNKYYSKGGVWYTHDWRGRKGQPPTPEQILETINNARKASEPKQQSEARYNRVIY